MTLEQEFFQKKQAVFSKLVSYGFTRTSAGYTYSRVFMGGTFRAEITVENSGELRGAVIDNETDEEYTPLRIESSIGAYVGKVREEYFALLDDIAKFCFIKEPFASAQANAITRLIMEKYQELPDNPFSGYPDIGIFRNPQNRKWYGIIMRIPASRIISDSKTSDNNEKIEVLNVKITPARKDELLAVPGIYPAYHMNKKSWITIALNNSVPDELIMELIETSRSLVTGAPSKKSAEPLSNAWIIPANPHFYDVVAAFAANNEIDWKQAASAKAGDIAFMYLGAPVSAVKYKCLITQADIPYHYQNSHITIKKLMRIKLLETYPQDFMPFARLKELGINAVRGPRHVTEAFARAIKDTPASNPKLKNQ
ncbi:MAG: MmcQ/YjbR family DNA-binding protein [bacterium]|nr:MmcQ/YjbR family DNA-binding protein [bacterium]